MGWVRVKVGLRVLGVLGTLFGDLKSPEMVSLKPKAVFKESEQVDRM